MFLMENTIQPPSASKMCEVLAKARSYKLEGYWEGSSYRYHPCGVMRRNMLFVNDWNTNNYCSVWVHTMNPVQYMKWDNNPAHNGNPVPHPVEGERIKVYSSGRWLEDGPWQQAIVDVIVELETEIAVAAEKAKLEVAAKIAENDRKRRELLNAAAATFSTCE